MAIKWNPTTEKHYDDMLGCLPPASWGNGGFQVGEPFSHRGGLPTFETFKCIDGEYFVSDDALTFREFKAEFPDAVYCYNP